MNCEDEDKPVGAAPRPPLARCLPGRRSSSSADVARVAPGGGRSSATVPTATAGYRPPQAASHRPPQAAILGQRIETRPPGCDGLSADMLSRGIFHTDR